MQQVVTMTVKKLDIYYGALTFWCTLFLIAAVADNDKTNFITEKERQSIRQFGQDAQEIFKQIMERWRYSVVKYVENLEFDRDIITKIELPHLVLSENYLGTVIIGETALSNIYHNSGIVLGVSLNNIDFIKIERNIKLTTNKDDEIQWILLRKSIVNEIHGLANSSAKIDPNPILIQIPGILKMFEIEMVRRGLKYDKIKEISFLEKVDWLLNDLGKVKQNPDIVKIYLDLQPYTNKQHFLSTLYKIASAILVHPKAVEILKKYDLSEFFIEQLVSVITNDLKDSQHKLLSYTYLPIIIREVSKEILNYKNLDSTFDILFLERFIFHYNPEIDAHYSINVGSYFLKSFLPNGNQKTFVHSEL